MAEKGKAQPPPPKSPDSLQLHGNVRGVTRIGRKAILAGSLIGGLVILLIVFGAQNGPKKATGDPNTVPAAASPQGGEVTGHFGENVPLALPTAAPTPTPLPVLATPAPAVSQTVSAAAANEPQANTVSGVTQPVAPAQSAAEVEAAREAQERRVTAAAAADARRQVISSANHAPIIMAGGNSGSTTGAAAPGAGTNPAASTTVEESPSASASTAGTGRDPTAFLNGPVGQLANGGAEHVVSGDRIAPQTPYEVVAGSVIPADLVTGINSQNPGLITGQVREDVYDSLTGKYLLIPRGSKLIGVYKNDVAAGQMRVLIAWKRLIFPDTAAIDLVNMSGADVEGNAGFIGRTDTHFGQLLAQTLLASIITAGLQLSQPQQSTSSTTTGATTVVPPGAIAAGSVGQSVAQALTQEIQSQSQIPPTITIPRGYPFVVVVDRDLVLTSPYTGGQ